MLSPKEFQEQRIRMADFYVDTEKRFLELIQIIPLDNNPETYSPRLYDILQSSCSQVENMLRLICDIFEKKHSDNDFPEYHNLLNENGILDMQHVFCLKLDSTLYPFEIKEGEKTPFWWKGYNSTKHKLPEGLKAGNLINTIHALSATYALHTMAYYAQFSPKNFFNSQRWFSRDVIIAGDREIVRMSTDSKPISEIFFNRANFCESGAPT